MNGYAHPEYAASLAEFGTPRRLSHSGGSVLERSITQTPYRDVMGCYPLFACQEWSLLDKDLDELQGDVVSLALVADPFGDYDQTILNKCFPDLAVPFKDHMVTDLSRPPDSYVNAEHRRKAQKALERVNVERCEDPAAFTAEWNHLYANLIRRHNIRGLTAFSAASFGGQLAVPGLVMFRATSHDDEALGMTLWYVDRGVAYYHLGAYNDAGYNLESSFALFWQAINYFSDQGLKWLNLGASAGLSADPTDGLSRFKRGWSTGTRTAYLCGKIFDPQKYSEIMKARNITASDYFPAYRKGEFV